MRAMPRYLWDTKRRISWGERPLFNFDTKRHTLEVQESCAVMELKLMKAAEKGVAYYTARLLQEEIKSPQTATTRSKSL